jgi:hypothetical protein
MSEKCWNDKFAAQQKSMLRLKKSLEESSELLAEARANEAALRAQAAQVTTEARELLNKVPRHSARS